MVSTMPSRLLAATWMSRSASSFGASSQISQHISSRSLNPRIAVSGVRNSCCTVDRKSVFMVSSSRSRRTVSFSSSKRRAFSMAIAALLARTARTASASPSMLGASGGDTTASAPTSSPSYDIGSASNDPSPGATRLWRCPATTSGSDSQPANASIPGACGATILTDRPSPSRSAIAADAPWPAIDAAVRTTWRCSSLTPPAVLVRARATASTRSTALSVRMCAFEFEVRFMTRSYGRALRSPPMSQ